MASGFVNQQLIEALELRHSHTGCKELRSLSRSGAETLAQLSVLNQLSHRLGQCVNIA
jgi:hypothetical protein